MKRPSCQSLCNEKGIEEENVNLLDRVQEGDSFSGIKKQKISPPHHIEEEDGDIKEAKEEKKNPFDMLPNELLFQILAHHLPPFWHMVCLRVCQQWRLILSNNKTPPTYLFSTDYLDYLAYEGLLNVLQWARSQGCPWDEWACANAARGGHLEVLQWARSQGCPWDEDTCANAARGGHLEVLQWLKSQGCPWIK